ncbi:MAG: NADH-quinone oxidoreductase subunit N [Bacteroidetes bacterium]|nr:MAG: NADH-quinone oxidoreductase subunit N [Bacteroidota bacterium]
MELSKFLIMRSELSLLVVILLLLIVEIFSSKRDQAALINLATGFFLLHTILGFMPGVEGVLFGGMYQHTALTEMMKNILNVGVLILLMQSSGWLKMDSNIGKVSEYFMLTMSTLMGMYFMISAGDFLMMYLGLELATIPLAALVAYNLKEMKSIEAGAKFILLAALSSGIMLFGISLIYGSSGSVIYTEVMGNMNMNTLQIVAMVFFLAGLGFKISLVPFHFWTADVYEGAPANVAAYLSVISKGASAFVLVTLLFTVFKDLFAAWEVLLYAMAVLTMTVGNLFALRQQNMQRFLAFSSIAQAGFILLGIISGTHYGMTTVIYFVLVYVFSNLGAFGVISIVQNATGKFRMDDYSGFYQTNPRLSLVMLLSLFSLAGIPPVAGFFGKFFLFAAAAEQGYYWLVIIAVLNTIISLYYYLRVVKRMFLERSDKPIALINSDFLTKTSIALSVVGILVVGVLSQVFDWISLYSWGM